MHYSKKILDINENLKKTKKLFISSGCSYVAGKAAWPKSFMEEFRPNFDNYYYTWDHLSNKQKELAIKKFPIITNNNNVFETINLEVDNSFTSILHKNYIPNYTIANLGEQAKGLFSSVMNLYVTPIQFALADEIILFFCPTDLQRFDILSDEYAFTDSNVAACRLFNTFWPFDNEKKDPIGLLQLGYSQAVHSLRFEIVHAIMCFKLLINWIEQYKAKLIIFPAFNKIYNKNYFYENLDITILRDKTLKQKEIKHFTFRDSSNFYIDNFVPWDNFTTFDGFNTFFDLAFGQEKNYDPNIEMQSLVGPNGGTLNQFIMKCGHPGVEAHELLAKKIYEKYF